ncbi:MAG TPA: 4-(cytidine 5'-diphospho)-2-C-methyl-D-erythritol kinase [bacterium]|nr:4-(cytidine 5'-diphospho)-2-C-methyl-D-erythritol kinase [bacterium]
MSLTLTAPAKINLSLEVLGKRNDGYHEVRMLMAGLSLADSLGFKAAKGLALSCDVPGLDCGESNLVLRAARALQKATGCTDGAQITLKKRIPLGGGLAGGSTDAAAALKGLNNLWGCGLGLAALEKLGATLGSDIPFCLRSGWAIATGRGEKLKPLALRRKLHFVLLNPGFEVSTKWAYQSLGSVRSNRRNLSRMAFEAIQAKDSDQLARAAVNDLEPVTAGRYAEIGRLRGLLDRDGAQISRMSGSGPSVWGLFKDETGAKKACQKLKNEVPIALYCSTIGALKES